MASDKITKLFVSKYSALGDEKFYKFLITYAMSKIVEASSDKNNPAFELLDYYEMFLKLHRREGYEIYLDLAKQLRKAGHKIYRISLKKGLMVKSVKFLNLV